MTIEQARKAMQKEWQWASHKAIDYALAEGLKSAKRRSSGGLTYKQMRQEDHPYAVRHGVARRDPSVINSHRGVFKRGWFTQKVFTVTDWGGAIINDSENAGFLKDGTRFMVRRPIDDAVGEELRTVIIPQAENVFKKELESGNQ